MAIRFPDLSDPIYPAARRAPPGLLTRVATFLDTPGGFVRTLLDSGDVGRAWDSIWDAEKRSSGWDLLENLGIRNKKGPSWHDPLAFLVEAATDPLMFVGAGATKAGQAATKLATSRGVARAASSRLGPVATKRALGAPAGTKFTDELIEASQGLAPVGSMTGNEFRVGADLLRDAKKSTTEALDVLRGVRDSGRWRPGMATPGANFGQQIQRGQATALGLQVPFSGRPVLPIPGISAAADRVLGPLLGKADLGRRFRNTAVGNRLLHSFGDPSKYFLATEGRRGVAKPRAMRAEMETIDALKRVADKDVVEAVDEAVKGLPKGFDPEELVRVREALGARYPGRAGDLLRQIEYGNASVTSPGAYLGQNNDETMGYFIRPIGPKGEYGPRALGPDGSPSRLRTIPREEPIEWAGYARHEGPGKRPFSKHLKGRMQSRVDWERGEALADLGTHIDVLSKADPRLIGVGRKLNKLMAEGYEREVADGILDYLSLQDPFGYVERVLTREGWDALRSRGLDGKFVQAVGKEFGPSKMRKHRGSTVDAARKLAEKYGVGEFFALDPRKSATMRLLRGNKATSDIARASYVVDRYARPIVEEYPEKVTQLFHGDEVAWARTGDKGMVLGQTDEGMYRVQFKTQTGNTSVGHFAEDELELLKANPQFAKERRALGGGGPQIPEGHVDTVNLAKKLDIPLSQEEVRALAGNSLPQDIAEELLSFRKQALDPGANSRLLKAYDEVVGQTKLWVTLPWPAFHVRNMTSNIATNMLAGVRIRDYLEAGKMLASKKGRQIADAMKVTRGGWHDEVARDFLQGGRKGPGKLIAKWSEPIGRYTEDLSRVAHYVAKRRQGKSAMEAADSVRRYLFNYDELMPFEKHVMKRAFLWYTWQRKVTEFLVRETLTNPGGMAQMTRLAGQPSIPRDQIPDYLRSSPAIPFGEDKEGNLRVLAGLGLPVEELARYDWSAAGPSWAARLSRLLQNQLQGTAPPIKGLLELTAGKDFFLDRPLLDADRAPSWMRALPGPIKDAISFKEYEDKSGRTQYRADPYLLHALRLTPASRLSNSLGKISDPRRTWGDALTNLLSGARTVPVDPEREKLRSTIRDLKDALEAKQQAGTARQFPIFFATQRDGKRDPETLELLEMLRLTQKRLGALGD